MKLTPVQKINFLLLCLIVVSYPGQNYFQRLNPQPGEPKVLAFNHTLDQVDIPLNNNTTAPYIVAASAIVIDPDSGTILYQKNPYTRLHPASTTKIMTALVALDSFKLDDIITVKTADQAIGNTMKLIPGDQLKVIDLLKGLLIASGNDAAVAFAENFSGGYSSFIEAMNQKALTLHLKDTHYTNVSGIEGANHKTSSLDLAILTKEAVKNDTFLEIVGTTNTQVTDIAGVNVYPLHTTNELLGEVEGLLGVKTGWTQNAGECLVTLTQRDNHRLITVVLNSPDRFGESKKLINWAFSAHTWQIIE